MLWRAAQEVGPSGMIFHEQARTLLGAFLAAYEIGANPLIASFFTL
jgi:hypothetical protein